MSDSEVDVSITATTDAFTSNIERAVGVLAGLTGAFLALKDALDFVEDITATALEFEKLAAKTGMASEELGGLKLVSEESGVSFEAVGGAMNRLARSMEAAKAGTGTVADAYRALGITVTDASGHLKSTGEVLDEVADKFAGMQNGTTKTSLAIELFGRAGAEMIPVLNQGSAGIREATEKAIGLGTAMGGDTLARAKDFRIAMDDLHASFEGIVTKISDSLLPAFAWVTNLVGKLVAQVGLAIRFNLGLIDVFAQLVTNGLGAAKNAYADLIEEMEKASKTIDKLGEKKPDAEGGQKKGRDGAEVAAEREKNLLLAQSDKEEALNAIAMDEEKARHAVAMGQETEEWLLQQKLEFAQRRIQAESEYALKVSNIYAGMEKEQEKADAAGFKSVEAAGRERDKAWNLIAENFAKTWQDALQSVGKNFSKAFDDMFNRTASFGDGVKNIFKSIQTAALDAISQMLFRWIAAETEKTAASALAAIKHIASLAGESAAGAFASQAAIPIVGPELGAAAAAEAFGAVMGFGSFASAAGGFDIPAGLNPMTQLHAEEMVLPADLANGLRQMLATGGGAGMPPIHIHAMDGASVKRVLMDNARDFGAAIRAAVRGGHVTGAVT